MKKPSKLDQRLILDEIQRWESSSVIVRKWRYSLHQTSSSSSISKRQTSVGSRQSEEAGKKPNIIPIEEQVMNDDSIVVL